MVTFPALAAVGPEVIQRGQQQDIESQQRTVEMQSIAAQSPYVTGEIVSDNANVVIADLSNITRRTESDAKYSPAIIVGYKQGSAPTNGWDKENGDWYPYQPERSPTPVDEFIDYITGQIGGLGESIGDVLGGFIGNLIIKNTSGQKIENLIMKYPQMWIDENIEPEFNPNLPPVSPDPTRLQKFCNVDGCHISEPTTKSLETPVNSVIKFGE